MPFNKAIGIILPSSWWGGDHWEGGLSLHLSLNLFGHVRFRVWIISDFVE